MATEKIPAYATSSVFFLPGRNRHACSGAEAVLILVPPWQTIQ